MKMIRVILVLQLLIGVVYAQTPSRLGFSTLFSSSNTNTITLHPNKITSLDYISAPVLKPYLNTYRYTAFFCKMELKTVNYFGIYIKVHAGDYDSYTKETYRTR